MRGKRPFVNSKLSFKLFFKVLFWWHHNIVSNYNVFIASKVVLLIFTLDKYVHNTFFSIKFRCHFSFSFHFSRRVGIFIFLFRCDEEEDEGEKKHTERKQTKVMQTIGSEHECFFRFSIVLIPSTEQFDYNVFATWIYGSATVGNVARYIWFLHKISILVEFSCVSGFDNDEDDDDIVRCAYTHRINIISFGMENTTHRKIFWASFCNSTCTVCVCVY